MPTGSPTTSSPTFSPIVTTSTLAGFMLIFGYFMILGILQCCFLVRKLQYRKLAREVKAGFYKKKIQERIDALSAKNSTNNS